VLNRPLGVNHLMCLVGLMMWTEIVMSMGRPGDLEGGVAFGINPGGIGINPVVFGTNPVAIGTNTVAIGTNPVAIGTNPVAATSCSVFVDRVG
jgi:hypothetical protein